MQTIVHILFNALPLCGFTTERPGNWPAGQRWVSHDDRAPLPADHVYCEDCVEERDNVFGRHEDDEELLEEAMPDSSEGAPT